MDYATLSLADVKTGLDEIAREVQAIFGGFDVQQLNWRPDAVRWTSSRRMASHCRRDSQHSQ